MVAKFYIKPKQKWARSGIHAYRGVHHKKVAALRVSFVICLVLFLVWGLGFGVGFRWNSDF